MSVVHLLDTVAAWARPNICDHVKLKQPPVDENAPEDGGYDYTLVNPAIFTMYVPTVEKLAPNIHSPFPSLCVRFMQGAESMASRSGFVDVQLCFSTWDPGHHVPDSFKTEDGIIFRRQRWGEQYEDFERNGDGWRDAWNFVDTALRAVESVTAIGEYTIDQTVPIEFGPLKEQEAIPDFYPFWFAWMSFRLKYSTRRYVADIEELL